MRAACFLSSLRHLDTLLIPGGRGMRTSAAAQKLASWISRHEHRIRRIASVCTGIFGVAPTGLLNGRKVTTHWKFSAELVERYPELKVDANPLYVRDGKFYTSAGITAGIDLALALIEEDFGAQVALSVARELVMYVKRPGGQEQYSEPLKFQVESTSRFADLAAWMVGHLDKDLSVEALAERINLAHGSLPAASKKNSRALRLRSYNGYDSMRRAKDWPRPAARLKASPIPWVFVIQTASGARLCSSSGLLLRSTAAASFLTNDRRSTRLSCQDVGRVSKSLIRHFSEAGISGVCTRVAVQRLADFSSKWISAANAPNTIRRYWCVSRTNPGTGAQSVLDECIALFSPVVIRS